MTEAVAPGYFQPFRLSECLEHHTGDGPLKKAEGSLSSFPVQQANVTSLIVTTDPKKFGKSRKTQLSASFFLFSS